MSALTVGVLLSIGCTPTGHDAPSESAESDRSVERVTAGAPVRKDVVLTTSLPAQIKAYETAPLYSKLPAYVEEVHVDIGDSVEAGEMLVTLAVPELANEVAQQQAMLEQSRAERQQAEASLEAAKAAADTAKAHVTEAEAGIARTDADAARWQAELDRIKALAASGSVTAKLVDETQSQYAAATAGRDEALAAIESAKAGLRESQSMISKAESDLVAAGARVGVAQANLDRAQTMLGYTTVKAPFAGTVISRAIDTGAFVQPASGTAVQPLLVIARLDKVRVQLDVPELDAPHVQVGDPATLRIQSLPGSEYKATVARTSGSLDKSSRTLRTEIDIDNAEQTLRPGMYATVTLELARADGALTLPATAIVREGDQAICHTVVDGKIARVPIKLGFRSGTDCVVLDGLAEDATVVLLRPETLKPGQQVELIEPTKSP